MMTLALVTGHYNSKKAFGLLRRTDALLKKALETHKEQLAGLFPSCFQLSKSFFLYLTRSGSLDRR
jgi:hypothetical protein